MPKTHSAKPREAGAVFEDVLEVGHRHGFRLGYAVDVHELRKHELDVVLMKKMIWRRTRF